MESVSKIFMGFYLGIGDFVSALPSIRYLAEKGSNLTVVASHTALDLVELLNFDTSKIHFIGFDDFSFSKIPSHISTVKELLVDKVDVALISPCTQDKLTSWKLPILVRFLKFIKWRRCKIIGAYGDRMSFLYDERIPIDKSVPLVLREETFLKIALGISPDVEFDKLNLFNVSGSKLKNSVILHIGASKEIKKWRFRYWEDLIEILLNDGWSVGLTGTEKEIKEFGRVGKVDSRVDVILGSLKDVVKQASKYEFSVVLDSGFSHISALLGLKTVIIYGPSDPSKYSPPFGNVAPVFNKKFFCQPCDSHKCRFKKNYCMSLVTPRMVFDTLKYWGTGV